MSGARVQSIDALKSFRLALLKFAEAANSVLTDADAEIQRAANWLETEQRAYWEHQIRLRTEAVARAKLQVQIKRSCRNVDGSPGSAIEEEKALKLAVRRLEEAEQKSVKTRQGARWLQREALNYRGQIQRFATAVAVGIPRAVGRLDAVTRNLGDYVDLPQEGTEAVSEAAEVKSPPVREADESPMARPAPEMTPELTEPTSAEQQASRKT